MPLILSQLIKDYPSLKFIEGDDFRWSPEISTIFYKNDGDEALLLHELGHALLHHQDYDRDVTLLTMERDAWDKARTLPYSVAITDDTVQDHLDTYRKWLHARSTCPTCSANGQQVKKFSYHCIACGADWRVNEARLCGLKRYTIKIPS
jgi:hypothetical protein